MTSTSTRTGTGTSPSEARFMGIDVGAETIKVVELIRDAKGLRPGRRRIVEHRKEPGKRLVEVLAELGWGEGVAGAAVSGRLSRMVNLPRVPTKQAQATGMRHLHGEAPSTVVSIGSHGFSVLELRPGGVEVFRENGRCSQGTGNFLRQLVERFDLTVDQASTLCAEVTDPAPLSGRCPVILKTDMTHLANKGESKARILAGLYDAVCENVQVLLKPRLSPPRVGLVGGVSRSGRIRGHFARFCERHGMELIEFGADDALFLEALGDALVAVERPAWVPALDGVIVAVPEATLDRVPALSAYLNRVKRMPARPPIHVNGTSRKLVLGFDIGSTGSKAVALDDDTREVVWQGYVRTNGSPVGAAQALMRQFVDSPASRYRVTAVGATGSGREIVGSLMTTCYGSDAVFVLNEIAAHAEGALHYDHRVDTIFEIGGQDAKYIRLAEGRVVDAAMNEACSAGTGSFIEEQGRKFSGIDDVVQLGEAALRCESGVSLGQHCSVFMAEIIDEAVAAGVEQASIIAGIYDSIIQNYLNRVKGSRSVGQVIFCQGMPFASDALAAAVARQTGGEVIVPPDPGTVGALGIALLTLKHLVADTLPSIEPQRFLDARVEGKDTFICKATQGCGGSGNKCRIDRLFTVVDGARQRFTWGGGCSLYDKGTRKQKLPDLAPDPFRDRQALIEEIIARVTTRRDRPRVALTDEFQLKGMFPFFARFLNELGFDLIVKTGADQSALKRGIEEANVPFCAPMQQFHGIASALADEHPDFIFVPMLRTMPRVKGERTGILCPIVQASPDLVRLDLPHAASTRLVSPVIDVGVENLASPEFARSCTQVAEAFGVNDPTCVHAAFEAARTEQERFDGRLLELGRRALAFCAERGVTPVAVLGRVYTIYNTVLNSNVPSILREQGAIAIPVDCFPIADETPIFNDMYWGYGQRNLRLAHQLRRTPGVYGVYCSNYSCGPDSFTLHFFSYIMEGKPFAIIETDGHSGDAGTKTRIEAFLHCVREDRVAEADATRRRPRSLKAIEIDKEVLPDIIRREERVLIPRMGPGADALAACLRGIGVPAESLPEPDRETVRIGRRYTSGKECVPMTVTLGSVLQRLDREQDTEELFALFMPSADGPCRFGVYNLLDKIVFERLGWKDRIKIWSPNSNGYFDGVSQGFALLAWAGFLASDMLLEALYHTRPVENRKGAAQAIYDRYQAELSALLEREAAGDTSLGRALKETASGGLFGVRELLAHAAADLAAVKLDKQLPTVLVVGEIYVRCDPFSNDFVIEKLEQRGIRCRFAAFNEWIEYMDHMNLKEGRKTGPTARLTNAVQNRAQQIAYDAVAVPLGWAPRTRTEDSLSAAAPYLTDRLVGEAALTVGGAVHEHREGIVDGVVSVGPLECMPNKVAEAQFFHAAEREGLLSLTLSLNGDPVDPEVIDNFAYEVHSRFRRQQEAGPAERATLLERSRELWARVRRAVSVPAAWGARAATQVSATATRGRIALSVVQDASPERAAQAWAEPNVSPSSIRAGHGPDQRPNRSDRVS